MFPRNWLQDWIYIKMSNYFRVMLGSSKFKQISTFKNDVARVALIESFWNAYLKTETK